MQKSHHGILTRRKLLESAGILALGSFFPWKNVRGEGLAPGPADWPRYGYDLQNSRFNRKEKTLGRKNVANLKLKWQSEPGGPIQTCATVIGDDLFYASWDHELRAVEATTGRLKWAVPTERHTMLPPHEQGIRTSPQYEGGKLYFADDYTSVHGVDAVTGKLLWSTRMDPNAEQNGSQTRHSPAVFRGKVVTGHAGWHPQIACLDAENGRMLWRFYTGTGGLWTSPAIDEEKGIVYNVTGNAKGIRPNDPNLYTDSVLAHDLESGELLWYDQISPSDPSNLEFSCHPMLHDARGVRGSIRQCVSAGHKRGLYTYDRYTGKLLWKAALTPAGMAGGPAADSTAAAYNRIYLTSNATTSLSSITACLNAYTGEIEWWVPNQSMIVAAVAVANGVFYQGRTDGMVQALDAETGKLLWEYKLPSACRGGISVANGWVYAAHGEIYSVSKSGGPLGKAYSVYAFRAEGE